MSTCGRGDRLCTVSAHAASDPDGTKAPVPERGTRASRRSGRGAQRQRIDMISPATMAPKPIAKFQAPSDTMNGISSPAT